MQYGNFSFRKIKFIQNIGLNRTMQYGNYVPEVFYTLAESVFKSYYVVWKLFFLLHSSTLFSSFKSYYVVWKLLKYHGQYQCVYMFKSYYVVWKLSMWLSGKGKNRSFKSYYVVWKLEPHIFIHPSYTCLNRTMQYGNSLSTT